MDLFSGQWNLNDLALISFEGPDAANFLHSQLTNSVKDLPYQQAKPAAYCTAQGRILTNCIYWRIDETSFAVIVALDLLEAFIKRMKMFVLRSKLSINYLPDYKITGTTENMPEAIKTAPDWTCYKKDQSFWIKAPNNNKSNMTWHISKDIDLSNYSDNSSAWYAMRIAAGWPTIRKASAEKFLPSTLNMDVNGSIDFQKGCYPGQEIIARSHYRGTVKRRLAFAVADIDSSINNIDISDLYSSNSNKPIARIIDYAIIQQQIYIAAEANIADIDTEKYLLSPDGTVAKVQLIANKIA